MLWGVYLWGVSFFGWLYPYIHIIFTNALGVSKRNWFWASGKNINCVTFRSHPKSHFCFFLARTLLVKSAGDKTGKSWITVFENVSISSKIASESKNSKNSYSLSRKFLMHWRFASFPMDLLHPLKNKIESRFKSVFLWHLF